MIKLATLDNHQLDRLADRKHPFKLLCELSNECHKEWLVRDLLGEGEVSAWYGKPGDGKSVLVQDLAMHIAAGREWFGRPVRQGAVLYVALERAKLVERRAIAFRDRHEVGDIPFAVMGGVYDLRTQDVAEYIRRAHGELFRICGTNPALIIIDTLSRALAGGDENSPKDMGAIVNATARIQAPRIHVLLIHHTPLDGGDRLRGHSALLGAMDTTVSIAKAGGVRTATVVKANDSEEGAQIAFTLESVVIGTDEEGNETTAPVVVVAEGGGTLSRRRDNRGLPRAAATALRALREAIDACGQIPPSSNHIPADTKIVSVEEWRTYAYRLGISAADGSERARQMAFKRASENLIGRELVGFWNGNVWAS